MLLHASVESVPVCTNQQRLPQEPSTEVHICVPVNGCWPHQKQQASSLFVQYAHTDNISLIGIQLARVHAHHMRSSTCR